MKRRDNNLVWWIIGGIIILGLGGFVIYKVVQGKSQETSAKQKPAENNNKPSQTSPANHSPVPSKRKELEKYLLEKRLDLEKYFVFNLGELRNWEAETGKMNVREVQPLLAEYLTKIASAYLDQTGEKIINNRDKKTVIRFLGSDWNNVSIEWIGEGLDEKIARAKETYVIFEKWEDKFLYLLDISVDGKRGLAWTNGLSLRMEHPTTHIFSNKKEALEFLKNNDPLLINS